jgi:hypothetical protein
MLLLLIPKQIVNLQLNEVVSQAICNFMTNSNNADYADYAPVLLCRDVANNFDFNQYILTNLQIEKIIAKLQSWSNREIVTITFDWRIREAIWQYLITQGQAVIEKYSKLLLLLRHSDNTLNEQNVFEKYINSIVDQYLLLSDEEIVKTPFVLTGGLWHALVLAIKNSGDLPSRANILLLKGAPWWLTEDAKETYKKLLNSYWENHDRLYYFIFAEYNLDSIWQFHQKNYKMNKSKEGSQSFILSNGVSKKNSEEKEECIEQHRSFENLGNSGEDNLELIGSLNNKDCQVGEDNKNGINCLWSKRIAILSGTACLLGGLALAVTNNIKTENKLIDFFKNPTKRKLLKGFMALSMLGFAGAGWSWFMNNKKLNKEKIIPSK